MIRHTNMKARSQSQSRWMKGAAAILATLVFLPVTDASAVSARVKFACANDYFAHCSQFKPDTPGVRTCMRQVGDGLSKRCINALAADGEVTDADKAQHVASKRDDDE